MELLFESSAVRVLESRCRHPRSGPGPERGGEPDHLALFRRGGFRYHLGRRSHLGDVCTALLHRARAGYRVSHPGEDGDDITLIEPGPALTDELFGSEGAQELPLTPRVQLLHARQLTALRAKPAEALGHEERTLELLEAVALSRGRRALRPLGPAQRRAVSRVRELLLANLDTNLRLEALAAEAGCSPFHLMRLFRAETGRSLRAYRRELRVLAALPRLAAGEADLAGLAVELGFSHHSHLSQSFRELLGVCPRRLRAELHATSRARF